MVWVFLFGGAALAVVLGAGLWLLMPSLRLLGKHDFDPPASSEAARFEAEHKNTITGGGAMGGM